MSGINLADLVEEGLPQEIIDHLPFAEKAASENLEKIKIIRRKDIQSLSKQIEEVSTPMTPRKNRLPRLKFLASEWQKLFSSETACASGCSHCCHIDVAVSREEATLISKKVGIPLTEPKEFQSMLESTTSQVKHTGTPCTFLVNGACSIYSNRPIMCMSLVNMDSVSTLCKLQEQMVPVPYLNSQAVHMQLVKISMNDQFADIRDWFPREKS